jgi:DNA-binding MarR family transcriptional regulator
MTVVAVRKPRTLAPKPSARERAGASVDALERQSIGYLTRYAHRAFVRILAQELEAHGIFPGQWSVLRVLWQQEGLSQVELAERMRVEKASLTDVLDSMEAADLIKRMRNSKDRRKLNIFLTDAGQKMKQTLLPIAAKIDRKATRGMTAVEAGALRSLLSRVIVSLEA